MKQFAIKTLLFFVIIVFSDAIIGSILSFMVSHAVGGNHGRTNYICNQTNEEMLIFGSSRADHHYNPQILIDSLHLSCYNCGEDGNGIILNYARLLMIEQRYMPNVIIYEVTKGFDLDVNDNHKYIGRLKPYYERTGIHDIFESVDKTERWKMMSQLYRYNSAFFSILADYFHPIQSMGYQGFRPLKGTDTLKLKIHKTEIEPKKQQIDELKLAFLEKFIDHCKDVNLIFAISPIWHGMDTTSIAPIKDICRQRNVPLLDFSNDPKYVHNNEYFKDGSHLNSNGADEYTKDFIKKLKSLHILQKGNIGNP